MLHATPAAAGLEAAGVGPAALPVRLRGLPTRRLPGDLTVAVASRWRPRLLGLMRLRSLPEQLGLELRPCRSVHTLGMCFALDLVWLGADGEVIHVDRGVPPGRVRTLRGAGSVVEVVAGRGDAFAAAIGTAGG